MAYTIEEHDGMFDVMDDGLCATRNLKSREEAEAFIRDTQRGEEIAELAEINIESSITNLMRRFKITREAAKDALRSALRTS